MGIYSIFVIVSLTLTIIVIMVGFVKLNRDRRNLKTEHEKLYQENRLQSKIKNEKEENFRRQETDLEQKEIEFKRFSKKMYEKIERAKEIIRNEKVKIDLSKQELEKLGDKLKSGQAILLNEKQKLNIKKNELLEREKKLLQEFKEFEERKSNDELKNDLENSEIKKSSSKFEEYKSKKPIDKISPRRKSTKNPSKENKVNNKGSSQKNKICNLFPELICIKKGQCWHLEIKFIGDVRDFSNVQISKNGEGFFDYSEENNIIEKAEPILISWIDNGGEKEKRFNIFENSSDQISVFKIYTQNQDLSRFVSDVSYGFYCTIVPESWQRDKELSGEASREPENFSIGGYKVHFFHLTKISGFIIAFKNSVGKSITISPKKSRFELLGNIIEDYAEDIGPLFGDELPKLYDNLSWKDVDTIIIGEERENAIYRWEVKPELDASELDFNLLEQENKIGIVSKSKECWFFIRIYDGNENLIDSLDFRFIKGLKKIKIQNISSFPGQNGHTPAKLIFEYNDECAVKILKDEKKKIKTNPIENGTQAIIPTQPAWDLTYWEIEDRSGKKIEIEMLVERIWWSLIDERNPLRSNDWKDSFINLGKEYFKATSPYLVTIWLPKPRWINQFLVGFKKKLSKSIKVNASQRQAKIYLRKFCDAEEVVNHIADSSLNIWVEIDSVEKELTIIKVNELSKDIAVSTTEPSKIDIDNDPCCGNCDHARQQYGSIWCRRSHWPQQRGYEVFKQNIAHYKCGEWRGELDSDE